MALVRTARPGRCEVVVFKDSGGHHSGFSDERPDYTRMLDGVLLWVDDSRPDERALNDDPSAKTFYGFQGLMSEDARARMSYGAPGRSLGTGVT